MSREDKVIADLSAFIGQQVIVTEKMDGENTTLYRDGLHARSLTYTSHPSRSRVRALHAEIAHLIPEGWRVVGENLYARHSIHYHHLKSYFLLFSIWNEQNICLSWNDTLEWAQLLSLETVPVWYVGQWDEPRIRALYRPVIDGDECEGYVVRVARSFRFDEFARCYAKYVRAGHVQTDEHWLSRPVVPNELASQ